MRPPPAAPPRTAPAAQGAAPLASTYSRQSVGKAASFIPDGAAAPSSSFRNLRLYRLAMVVPLRANAVPSEAAQIAPTQHDRHLCTRRWNSRPRGGGIGPLRGGGVKAGHLRSCPFRGPKRMGGGVSSGGLWGGSPVCAG